MDDERRTTNELDLNSNNHVDAVSAGPSPWARPPEKTTHVSRHEVRRAGPSPWAPPEKTTHIARHDVRRAGPSPWKCPEKTAGTGPALPVARASWFPRDAVAHIYRPARSVMTSGKARTKNWVLRFERRTPPFIEPLMGWTGGDDTLTQVELTFPSREAAIAYAERQGLNYVVRNDRSVSIQPARDQEELARQQAENPVLPSVLLVTTGTDGRISAA